MANVDPRPAGAYVTYVESHGPFVRLWVQADRRATAHVEGLMAAHAPGLEAAPPPLLAHLVPGQLLAVQCRDTWYRARLLAAPAPPPAPLQLRFVDFGQCEAAPLERVRLPGPLAAEPPCAAPLLLARVVHSAGGWRGPQLDYLRRLLYGRPVQPRAELQRRDVAFAALQLDRADLADYLLANGVGVAVDVERQAQLYDQLKEAEAPPPPPTECSRGLTPARPLHPRGQRAVSELQRSSRGSPPSPSAYKTRRLEIGERHVATVARCDAGPEAFALRLKSDESVLASVDREIRSLELKNLTAPPSVGGACLGRFSDGSVRRCAVIRATGSGCELYSVDCGSTEWVSGDEVYLIPEELVAPRALAPGFCLAGLGGVVVDENLRRAFRSLVSGKTLTVAAVEPDGPPLVQYCELSIDGRDVRRLLLGGEILRQFEPIDPSEVRDGAKVSVSSVDGCSKFYVRLLDRDAELAETMERVEEHCSRSPAMPYPEMKPGAPCCAVYPEDGKWYRAQILRLQKDRATVGYVDYGNDAEVSVDCVKPIAGDLLLPKCQAIRCSLDGYEGDPFDKDAADRLEALTIDAELRIEVRGVLGKDVLLVGLFDDALRPADLALHLKNPVDPIESPQKIAEPLDEPPPNFNGNSNFDNNSHRNNSKNENSSDSSQSSNYRTNRSRSKNYNENKSFQRNDREERTKGKLPDDSQHRRKNFDNRNDGQNFSKPNNRSRNSNPENKTYSHPRPEYNNNTSKMGQRLINAQNSESDSQFNHQREYSKPDTQSNYREEYSKPDTRSNYRNNYSKPDTRPSYNRDEYPKRRERPPQTPKTLNNPAPFETRFNVRTLNPSTQYKINIPWFIDPNNFYVHIITEMDEFNQMMARLPNIYSGIKSFSGFVPDGASVIAQNPEDRVLYRAEVIANVGGSDYLIQYVDFGNKNIVSGNKIWQVESELFELPSMAVKCSLSEVKPIDDKWSADNREDNYFNSDSYDCTFLNCESGIYSVSLFNNRGFEISEMMVKDKLALYTDSQKQALLNKGDDIDYHFLMGQKFYSKFVHIERLTKFYLCFEPLISNDSNIPIDSLATTSLSPIECSIFNLNETTCKLSLADFVAEFNNKYVIAYVNKTTNRVYVTLYDAETGKKIEYFDDGVVAVDENVICPHPIFNKNLGPTYVSHVASINDIYLQRSKNTDSLQSLLNELFVFYDSKEDAETLVSPKINDFCAAKSSDENWYRAKVINVSSDECEVLYIDYGNTETIALEHLKTLDKQFFICPEFALRCQIKNSSSESAVTDDQLKELLLDKELQVELNKSNTLPVKWLSTLTLDNVNIVNDLFGVVASEPNVSKDVIHPNNDLQLLTVFVSHIDGPGQFWLQISTDIDELDNLNSKLENVDDFDDLLEFESGTQCIAKYSACETYYRAVILDSDADIVTVRFIDYGNTDVLSNTPGALKSIPKDWPAIRPLAMKCSVNASPTGMGEWTEHASNLFTESIGDIEKAIQAKIILQDTTTYVDLYVNGANITDVLVNAGHATPAEKLSNSEPLTCYTSHINSISEFWIQLETNVPDLDFVSEELTDAENFPPLNEIEEEVICVAKYLDDESWYRAKIIVKGSDGTEVLFMDYGNASLTTELRSLPDKLRKLPALSRKCSLKKPVNIECWSKAAEKRFTEIAADGATPFQVVFNASGDISIVELLIDGKPITDELVTFTDTKKDDTPVLVKISNNYGPNDFWVQYATSLDDLSRIENDLINIESYDVMSSDEIIKDTLCISLFSDDNLWYRSRVLERNETITKVVHIDYGTIAETESVRKISSELQNTPPFSKHCTLSTESVNNLDDTKFIKYVSKSSQFYVNEIDSNCDPIVVELFTKDFKDYINIMEMLIESDIDSESFIDKSESETIVNEELDNDPLPSNINDEYVEPSKNVEVDIDAEVNVDVVETNVDIPGVNVDVVEVIDNGPLEKSDDSVEQNEEIVSNSEVSDVKEDESDDNVEKNLESASIPEVSIVTNNESVDTIKSDNVSSFDLNTTESEIGDFISVKDSDTSGITNSPQSIIVEKQNGKLNDSHDSNDELKYLDCTQSDVVNVSSDVFVDAHELAAQTLEDSVVSSEGVVDAEDVSADKSKTVNIKNDSKVVIGADGDDAKTDDSKSPEKC